MVSQNIDNDAIGSSDDFVVTRHRHKVLLEDCHSCLASFLDKDKSADMACEDLRSAVKAVSKITGHIDTEEVLDVLFRDFCIGK